MFLLPQDVTLPDKVIVDTATGYALNVPLWQQEPPDYWKSHPEVRDHILTMRKMLDIVVEQDEEPPIPQAKSNPIREIKERRVRTPAGSKFYDLPIGAVIVGGKHLPNLQETTSEHEGWKKYLDGKGKEFYVGHDGKKHRVVDAKDRVLHKADSHEEALQYLHDNHAKAPTVPPGMHLATAKEREELKKRLAVPPAWRFAMVADDMDNAELLAKGYDTKGRMQPIYSAAHWANQAAKKYSNLKMLHKQLPKLDKALKRDAEHDDDAAALMIIRKMGMRPGSTGDTKAAQQAYGATTLQRRHVTVYPETGRVTFNFIGKKGVHIVLTTKDPDIFSMISTRMNKSGEPRDSLFDTSDDKVRRYLHEQIGKDFKVKDLRTYHGTAVAKMLVDRSKTPIPTSKKKFLKMRMEVAKEVAKALGNDPAEAIKSYINPVVFSKWDPNGEWS